MKICAIRAAGVVARLSLLLMMLLLMGSICVADAQSSYTVDLPSVERVKAEIKGSDETDALARQTAVFSYLLRYIYRIKYNRTVTGSYTPEEERLVKDYTIASYQISQEFAKTHTPEQVKAFVQLGGQYDMDSAFYKDWSARLIGKQAADQYHRTESELGARQAAHVADVNRMNDAARAATTNGNGLSNDPTAVTTRRCLELGGDSIACAGKGFISGAMGMAGVDEKFMEQNIRPGVMLNGSYRNPNTVTQINFATGSAEIANCGKLAPEGRAYGVRKSGPAVEVVIESEPRPITLAMRPDGGLLGPGLVDVKGNVIVGYYTQTRQLMVNGTPAVGAAYGCTGACVTTTSTPKYEARMDRCTLGALSAPRGNGPATQQVPGAEALGMLLGISGGGAAPPPIGLRMAGKYSNGNRMTLDFTASDVVIDCGQAHVRVPYTVENTPSRFVVNIANNGGPFSLSVEQDNSLRGNGLVTVNGRLVSGMRGSNVSFVPHVEQCDVSRLSAQK